MIKRVLQAFDNVKKVIVNTKLTAMEHNQLAEDLLVISGRCMLADKLEKKSEDAKE